MPESTVVFPLEPNVQVIAPIAEAQAVETILLNQIHFQFLTATMLCRLCVPGAGVSGANQLRLAGRDGCGTAAAEELVGGKFPESDVAQRGGGAPGSQTQRLGFFDFAGPHRDFLTLG